MATLTEIKNKAKELRSKASTSCSTREKLTQFARLANAEIKYVADNSEAECANKNADGTYTIQLPTNVSEVRNNFTIAHELGHIHLKHEPNPNNDEPTYTRANGNPKEIEANQFAAELLMPEDEIRALIKDGDYTANTVARKFGVSEAAASIRLMVLEKT